MYTSNTAVITKNLMLTTQQQQEASFTFRFRIIKLQKVVLV